MEQASFEKNNRETIIGKRFIESIDCPQCHGGDSDCKTCSGWGGLFIDPENKQIVDKSIQKEITNFWKNLGIEKNGSEMIVAQGCCACGYKKIIQTQNNPKDFTAAEKEIYGGHDYDTDCPHEPAINVH
jgi:hypothetical protein